jgi:hypothetical protein
MSSVSDGERRNTGADARVIMVFPNVYSRKGCWLGVELTKYCSKVARRKRQHDARGTKNTHGEVRPSTFRTLDTAYLASMLSNADGSPARYD